MVFKKGYKQTKKHREKIRLSLYDSKKHFINNCKRCNKKFETYKNKGNKQRFCCRKCVVNYYNIRKLGMFSRINRRKADETMRLKKIGIYNLKRIKIMKENKTGFFSPKVQSEMGKRVKHETHIKSGIKAAEVSRKNKPYYFGGVPFDSNSEREISMNIHYQFKISLIERRNCHFLVGSKEYDFFINRCFIELHPWDFNKRTPQQYYNQRRKNLNKNGYKNYNLIVIK